MGSSSKALLFVCLSLAILSMIMSSEAALLPKAFSGFINKSKSWLSDRFSGDVKKELEVAERVHEGMDVVDKLKDAGNEYMKNNQQFLPNCKLYGCCQVHNKQRCSRCCSSYEASILRKMAAQRKPHN